MDPTSYLPMDNLLYNGHDDDGGEAVTILLLPLYWKDGVPCSSDETMVNPYARVQMAGDDIGPINLHTFVQAHAQHTLSFLVSCDFVIKSCGMSSHGYCKVGLIMD